MWSDLRHDARMILATWGASRKPKAALIFRLLVFTPGFQFVALLRLQRAIGRTPVVGVVFRRALWYVTSIYFACDVDPQASIGSGLYVPHPVGIVIGGRVTIGSGVTILQNVTLGRGTTLQPQSPMIGDEAIIYAGAVIVGPIEIGTGAKIGANSVVTQNVPAYSVAVGVPARVIEKQVGNPVG